jgi:hypothetical protein
MVGPELLAYMVAGHAVRRQHEVISLGPRAEILTPFFCKPGEAPGIDAWRSGRSCRHRMTETVLDATHGTGRPIFFSITITLSDVIPVFVLTGQAGKRFHPLAFKIFAMAGATLLAVPLVLLLSSLQIGSKIRGEEDNTPGGVFLCTDSLRNASSGSSHGANASLATRSMPWCAINLCLARRSGR